jgi:YHS domain-containing protein
MTLVHRLMRLWLVLGAVALGATVLSGCGATFATVPNPVGEPVMLLGHDPVSYFTKGRPERGNPEFKVSLPERTYYFASDAHMKRFAANPSAYEPQYGGFCASGAAYAIKLGSDPTSWTLHNGRLFIFGDVLGKAAWELNPAWHVDHADRLWPEAAPNGWRYQSLKRYAFKVDHYKNGRDIVAEYTTKNPGKPWPTYDVGGMMTNLFFKPPGWRAAEGHSQPALGYAP